MSGESSTIGTRMRRPGITLGVNFPPEPLLRADHLSRTVQDRGGKRNAIVQDVSFELARGELIAITGPSGSGKSSLLRLLNRLDEPSSGTVWLGGVDYRSISPRELRRRVGMIMQRAFLFPGTIADNLRYGPRQRQQWSRTRKSSNCSAASDWADLKTGTSRTCRAGKRSALRSRAPWPTIPRRC